MLILLDEFKEISGCDVKAYLNEHEICVKHISDKIEELYARKYNYCGFGCVDICDRLLPIRLKVEIVNKKHRITIYKV